MSEQKGKIIIAVIVALIAVLILTGVSYYFFPPQGTPSSAGPKPGPMIPAPTPSNTTDTFTAAHALKECSSVSSLQQGTK